METKTFASKTVAIEGEDGRTIKGISAVAGVIDAGNDLIHKGAFAKTIQERGDRVKHLWQHDNRLPPIATITDLKEVGRTDLPPDLKEKYPEAKGGLLVTRKYLDTPRGNEVLAGLKSDPPAISEMSFGYDPIKFDFETLDGGKDGEGAMIRNLREMRLWDTSDVNWGMNEATMANVKSAMPYKDCGMAAMDIPWSKPGLGDFTSGSWDNLSDADKKRIAAHFAWTANMPPETFGDMKLPHHQASESGVGKAVWNGVRAAMGALMGARGGVNIPAGDKQAVYSHLSKHYDQFGKEPPTFKTLELLWAVEASMEEMSGKSDSKNVFEKLQELNELLRAEPQDAKELAALTLKLKQDDLLRRLAIKKRQVSIMQ